MALSGRRRRRRRLRAGAVVTLLAFLVAATLASLGTRAAGGVFVLAAVAAAWTGGTTATTATWTAALAAGLGLAGASPRRLAVPAVGATAALAAGAAGNAATVAGMWMLGTAAAVLSRPQSDDGQRWAFGLLQADLLVVGAVVFTAVDSGFSAWPLRLGDVGAGLLFVSAAVRIPAMAGPSGATVPGLLIVRTQVFVLLATAVRASSNGMLVAVLAAGAAVFAAGGLATLPRLRDAAQEAGLVAAALAVAGLGWKPAGWAWGAMAGGVLTHQLRLMAGRTPAGSFARAIAWGGGVGLPLLPVVGALLTASVTHRGWAPPLVVAGLAAGMAGRAWGSASPHEAEGALEGFGASATLRTAVVASASVAVGLAAVLLTLPARVAGDAFAWPAPSTAALVIVAALAGVGFPGLAPPVRAARVRRPVRIPGLQRAARVLDPPAGAVAIVGLLGVLAAASAGVLAVGWARGFL